MSAVEPHCENTILDAASTRLIVPKPRHLTAPYNRRNGPAIASDPSDGPPRTFAVQASNSKQPKGEPGNGMAGTNKVSRLSVRAPIQQKLKNVVKTTSSSPN